jgi:hypothetical protein
MSLARLVFHPQHLDDVPEDIPALLGALGEAGLTGALQEHNRLLPGDQFLKLLSFLGCSPNIHLHPDDGSHYCYLSINPVTDSAECLGYTVSVVPRCPACKHRIRDWQNTNHWQQAHTLCVCNQCASTTHMHQLKWRQECGYGRFSFHIAHIHPHEAVPAGKLLDTLQACSGFAWTYFYANN